MRKGLEQAVVAAQHELRTIRDEIGRAEFERQEKNRGGRPQGPTMPCGWGCGAQLTATQMRSHFTDCPQRPA